MNGAGAWWGELTWVRGSSSSPTILPPNVYPGVPDLCDNYGAEDGKNRVLIVEGFPIPWDDPSNW